MSPITAHQIREKLEDYLGTERYNRFLRDFVRVARRKGRLTYWLEQALSSAGISLTFEDCLPVFNLCHIHRRSLTGDSRCEECERQAAESLAAEKAIAKAEHKAGLILTIEDVFQIADRGTVVTGIMGGAWSSAKAGDPIEIRTPGRENLRTSIRDLERVRSNCAKDGGILLGTNVMPNQIPRGAKVVKIQQRSDKGKAAD